MAALHACQPCMHPLTSLHHPPALGLAPFQVPKSDQRCHVLLPGGPGGAALHAVRLHGTACSASGVSLGPATISVSHVSEYVLLPHHQELGCRVLLYAWLPWGESAGGMEL